MPIIIQIHGATTRRVDSDRKKMRKLLIAHYRYANHCEITVSGDHTESVKDASDVYHISITAPIGVEVDELAAIIQKEFEYDRIDILPRLIRSYSPIKKR